MSIQIYSIEGNIGSGKSTLIDKLKNVLIGHIVYLPEPVEIWNTVKDSSGVTILEKYYMDQERYAFSFQMMAYITRLKQITEATLAAQKNNVDTIIITERCLYTDREIFAKMLFDSGKIEEIEYSIYLRWFDFFNSVHITGIIYVKSSPEICLKRVNQRNRRGESIPFVYLEECHRYHEMWLTERSEGLDERSEGLGERSEGLGKPQSVIVIDGNLNVDDELPIKWIQQISNYLNI